MRDEQGAERVGAVVPISVHPRHGLREQLVSKRDFAAHVGYSTKQVERWVRRGMPAKKFGEARNAAVRIPLVEALAWLADNVLR